MTIDIKSMGYVRVASTDLEAWKTFAGARDEAKHGHA